MPKNKRPIVERRLAAVERALTKGSWNRTRVRWLASKFQVSVRQIYEDRRQVLDQWRADLPSGMNAKAVVSMRYDFLLRSSLKEGDLKTAKRIVDSFARVVGAYEPERVEVAVTVQAQADPLAEARAILDPEAQAWARRILADAGEPIPGVMDAPLLTDSKAEQ